MDFDVMDHLLIRYSVLVRYWRKNGKIVGQYITYLESLRRPMTQ
jgi:hypothetical protein